MTRTSHVDAGDDGLGTIGLGHAGEDRWVVNEQRVEADLFEPHREDALGIFHGPQAAAIGQGHECLGRDVGQEWEVDAPGACTDVEEDELVDALLVEKLHGVDGVTDVGRPGVVPRLDDVAVVEEDDR